MSEREVTQGPMSLVRLLAVGALIGALTLSCHNMLTGTDVTTKVGADVAAANAEVITITVRTDSLNPGGTPSLTGQVSEKVGVSFSLSSTVLSAYAFKNWTCTGSGSVTFSDPSSSTTTATITKGSSDIVIQANYYVRPILKIKPIDGIDNMNRNVPIVLSFTNPMDPDTVRLSDIKVEEQSPLNNSPWVDKTTDYFTGIDVSTDKQQFTLHYAVGAVLGPYFNYRITVQPAMKDLNGVSMVDKVVSDFATGSSTDDQPPVIQSVYVSRNVVVAETSVTTNAASVYLKVDAIDNTGLVPTLTISEYMGDSAVGIPIRSDIVPNTADAFRWTLKTDQGDGLRTITVQGTDPSKNTTTLDKAGIVKVVYDTTKPSELAMEIPASVKAPSQSVSVSAIDDLAGIATYALSGDIIADASGSASPLLFTLKPGDGTKNLTLTVTDNAGNISTTQRSVFLDTTPSTVSVGAPSSSGNIGYARNGNSLLLPFTLFESGSGIQGMPAVTIGGRTAIVSGSYPDYSATIAISANESSLAEGVLAYTIDSVDNAGNVMTQKVASTGITYDRTLPTVTGQALSSSNASHTYAKSGDIVTLSFTPNDANLAPTASVEMKDSSGTTVFMTNTSVAVMTGTANSMVNFTTPTGNDGIVKYSITVTDLAGNSATVSSGATSEVTVDNTLPTVTSLGMTSSNVNHAYAKSGDIVTLGFTPNDAHLASTASVAMMDVAGTTAFVTNASVAVTSGTANSMVNFTTPTGNDGTVKYSITVTDLAGNSATVTSGAASEVTVDNIAPTVTSLGIMSSNANHAYAKSGDIVTLGFTPNDAHLASTASVAIMDSAGTTSFAANGSVAVTSGMANSTVSFATPAGNDGIVKYSIIVFDLAGNSTTAMSGATSEVTVDNTLPTITGLGLTSSNANQAYAKSGDIVTLGFTPNDAHLASTASVAMMDAAGTKAFVTNSSVAVTSGMANSTVSFATPAGNDGFVKYSITVIDLAGNSATVTSGAATDVRIDNTLPMVLIGSPSRSYAKNGTEATYQITLADETALSSKHLTNSDIVLTGSAGTATSGAPMVAVSGSGSSYTVTVTAGSAEGTVGVTVKAGGATDAANNGSLEESSTMSFTVDNTKPTVTIGSPSASYAKNGTGVTYVVTFSDELQLSSKPLTTSDLMLTGTAGTATSGAPTLEVSGSGPSYTVTVTAGSAEGTVGITAKTGGATDAANNGSLEKSSTISFEVDNTLPTVTIGSPSASYAKESATITYEVTFADETHLSSHSLVKADITLTGTAGTATSGAPTLEVSGSGPSYTVTVTAGTAEGTVGITVAAEKASDGAGNKSPEKSSTTSFTVDNHAPDLISDTSITAIANSDGTISLSWDNPSDGELAFTLISWSSGTATVTSPTASYKTPVLGQSSYNFLFRSVDLAGNENSGVTKSGVTTDQTSVAIAFSSIPSISYSALDGKLTITYSISSGIPASLIYWTSDTLTPAATTTIPDPNSGMTIDLATPPAIFAFCLADSSDKTSISYAFSYVDSSYGVGSAKALIPAKGNVKYVMLRSGRAQFTSASPVPARYSPPALWYQAPSYPLPLAVPSTLAAFQPTQASRAKPAAPKVSTRIITTGSTVLLPSHTTQTTVKYLKRNIDNAENQTISSVGMDQVFSGQATVAQSGLPAQAPLALSMVAVEFQTQIPSRLASESTKANSPQAVARPIAATPIPGGDKDTVRLMLPILDLYLRQEDGKIDGAEGANDVP
ncbi:MAG TPA: hypothetical protein VMV83_00310 [Rectinemataceae bacterium]|nr:hypothetical protein [Rectinemataceae bacterium]